MIIDSFRNRLVRWFHQPELRIQLTGHGSKPPSYAKDDDGGLDLFANLHDTDNVIGSLNQDKKSYLKDAETWNPYLDIPPGQWFFIPVGVKMAIPRGKVGLIWPRSGHSKKGVDRLAGVIDASFRAEIRVNLINHHPYKNLVINHGDAVAQMIIQNKDTVRIKIVDRLDETERGSSGFGSSGR